MWCKYQHRQYHLNLPVFLYAQAKLVHREMIWSFQLLSTDERCQRWPSPWKKKLRKVHPFRIIKDPEWGRGSVHGHWKCVFNLGLRLCEERVMLKASQFASNRIEWNKSTVFWCSGLSASVAWWSFSFGSIQAANKSGNAATVRNVGGNIFKGLGAGCFAVRTADKPGPSVVDMSGQVFSKYSYKAPWDGTFRWAKVALVARCPAA